MVSFTSILRFFASPIPPCCVLFVFLLLTAKAHSSYSLKRCAVINSMLALSCAITTWWSAKWRVNSVFGKFYPHSTTVSSLFRQSFIQICFEQGGSQTTSLSGWCKAVRYFRIFSEFNCWWGMFVKFYLCCWWVIVLAIILGSGLYHKLAWGQ